MTVCLPLAALAGPDPVSLTRTDTRQKTVVTWHRTLVDHALIACGVVEPPPVYAAPGYLETTGPQPMLVYRAPGPMRPRRVAAANDAVEKSIAAPAASPAPAPAVNPAPAPAPAVPVPEPLPAGPEPGLLPDSNGGNPNSQNRTDELLSYFQRQHPPVRPNPALPAPGGEAAPNDPSAEPSFLQAPQAPEQPVLPPSRATYRVAP